MRSALLRGKAWKVRNLARLLPGTLGMCDYSARTLYIPVDGDTETEFDVCIHEALHACLPDLGETAVDETATSIARLLWRLQWRKAD
jgi:hypothetical protein